MAYTTSTIDPIGGYDLISIAMDGSGYPSVSYVNWNGTIFGLGYAKYNGTVWSTGTLDTNAGVRGNSQSLTIDGSGDPHVVYIKSNILNAADWVGAGLPAPMGGNPYGKVQAPTNFHPTTKSVGSSQVTWAWNER